MLRKNARRKLTYDELADLVVTLNEKIQALEKRVHELESELAKARKNSSNSSKPPSSDIVKPSKKKKGEGKRKIGGQPGHKKNERMPFATEEIDCFYDYTLDVCPSCHGELSPANEAPRIVQQIEIVETPVLIDEHCGKAYWCERCQKVHYAPLPRKIVEGGLAGPRLTALVAYMKGRCHASYATIQSFLRDMAGIDLSTGYLVKLVAKAGAALETPYNELLDLLPHEFIVNVDETGHKTNGDKFWTWCFKAELYVLFKIDKSRGSKVLIEVLGEAFDGVLGCDYFSAYRKYMNDFNIAVQFCIAHLIRNIRFLIDLPDKATVAYGEALLAQIREMFGVIHRREELTKAAFEKEMARQRSLILEVATTGVPDAKEAQNMRARFKDYGDAYFKFITTPGVEPTNNIAEQAIRFVVIDRHITQGTRSEKGQRWCERIWTVMATCALQKRSPFDFLLDAVEAYFSGAKPPSLLPSPL